MDRLVNRMMAALDGNGDIWKEFNDPPPNAIHSAGFWLWQTTCWVFYGLASLIYIPWALAMHLVFLVLLTISGCMPFWWRNGRKPFVFLYVLTVMLPGKYLWYNIFRDNRRRGKVWDFEMAKPRPIPLQKRRKLSDGGLAQQQKMSSFLTKLPAEIRLRIYSHVIVGEANFLSIVETQPLKKREIIKRRPMAVPCSIHESDNEQDDTSIESGLRELHRMPKIRPSVGEFSMGLPLLRTCRQIYNEVIDLFYSLTVFNFKDLHKPPFFIQTVLPQRLANIRSVHIVYDQAHVVKPNHVACGTAKFHHKIGECKFCNPIQWLNGIREHMVNLRYFEAYLFLKKEQRLPNMGDTWIHRLLDLQVGPNGLRRMKIDVSPKQADDDFAFMALIDEDEYVRKVRRLDEQLQQKLKAGIEKYNASQQKLKDGGEGTRKSSLAIEPPPEAHIRDVDKNEILPTDAG